jgi:acetyl esterase
VEQEPGEAPYTSAAPPGEPGARLDPSVAALLAQSDPDGTPSWRELPVDELRARWRADIRLTSGPGNPSVTSSDLRVPAGTRQVPIRVYSPGGSLVPPPAIVVYFHGGGFVFGDLDTHDAICRDMVAAGSFCCVAVDYRLSPEHRFPAALDDCVEVLLWVQGHTDKITGGPARVAVAGDSAGGNLAAAACLVLRDRAAPLPVLQVLVYPVLDLTMSSSSAGAFGPEYGLGSQDLAWFYESYLAGLSDPRHAYVSPGLAADLSGLPAAHVVTVGFDPLRDEGKAYAAALRAAGVGASARHYPGLIHGVLEYSAILPAGRGLLEDVAGVLASALSQ